MLTVQWASLPGNQAAVGSLSFYLDLLCPRAAVDCKLLFRYANMLFSLHGFDLGISHVSVTEWALLALKTLHSAHHNMHLLWQLVYLSPAKALKTIDQLPSLSQDATGSSHLSPKARAVS